MASHIYKIRIGDTLTSIAMRFGLTVPALLFVNPQITDPDVIVAGEYLHMPVIVGIYSAS